MKKERFGAPFSLVRVFITDLILRHRAEMVETYSKVPKMLVFTRDFEHERNMIMEKYITQNGIKYELKGEQYYPMLELPEQQ